MRFNTLVIKNWARRLAALVFLLILAIAADLLTDPAPQALIPVGKDAIIGCFSPDGRLIATHQPGGRFFEGSGPVRVWDTSSGRLRCTIAESWASASGIEFSPDSRWLIAAEDGHHWRMWDPSSGELRADLDLETRFGNYVGTRFTLNGRFLLLQQRNFDGGPEHVQFWDMETQQVRGSIEAHLWSMVFSTDGTTFGVHAYDRSGCVAKIETWKLGDGEAFATPLRRRNVEAARIISFSPTLDAFATATDRGDRTGPQEVQVRDMTTGTVLAQARYEDTETDISVLSFSNDGHFLIARAGRGNQDSQKSKIAVWDVRSGLANARTFLDESQHGTVSPDGKWLAQPNENGVEVVGTITGAGGGTFTRSGDYDFCWKSFYKTSRGSSGRAVFAPDSSSVVVSGYINMGRPSLLDKWVPARFNLLRGKGSQAPVCGLLTPVKNWRYLSVAKTPCSPPTGDCWLRGTTVTSASGTSPFASRSHQSFSH